RFAKSVEKIGAALARGDFAAAGLKKLSPTPYWRAKLNDEARLLMQFAPYRGETVCLFLEVIPNHVYEKSRFLRGAAIDWSKIESGPEALSRRRRLGSKEHDENQLLRISVPSGDHSPGDLALSPVHAQAVGAAEGPAPDVGQPVARPAAHQ